jgi:glycosyltransferase involved in cell wall biosynthesis
VRIALVLEHFDPQRGGLEYWAWQLAHALTRRGHSVIVVAFEPPGASPTPLDVRLLPWQESRLARARAVETALAEIRADVIHDLGVGWSADVLQPQMGCRLANYRHELRSLSGRRRLFHAIHPRKRRWLDEVRQLEQRQYRQTSCLVAAVSRMVAHDLNEFHSVAPERIRLIPNGVDVTRFSPATAERREQARERFCVAGRTVFLFAAHNPRLKGLHPLLRAFAASVAKRSDLSSGGDGPRARSGDDAFRSESIGWSTPSSSPDSSTNTGPWFAAADAFVLPTLLRRLQPRRSGGVRFRVARHHHPPEWSVRVAHRWPGGPRDSGTPMTPAR